MFPPVQSGLGIRSRETWQHKATKTIYCLLYTRTTYRQEFLNM